MSNTPSTTEAATSSRRAAERRARRHFVLARARELFATKGVEGTSMDDIATASEYTRRTLYSYFASRDDISLQVHLDDLRERWELQRRIVEDADDGLGAILAWTEVLYAFWKENPQAMQLERYWDYRGVEPSRLSGEVFQRFEALNDELAAGLRTLFRRGVEDGSLRADLQVEVCMSQFLYALRAVLARALSSSYSFTDIEPDGYVRHFLELFARGVRSEREGAER
jgi:AcrR family transcriptional regulator